jgi:hypothetical protein
VAAVRINSVGADGAARPDAFAVAADALAKMSATAAPMKPKKGALAGHRGSDMAAAEAAHSERASASV